MFNFIKSIFGIDDNKSIIKKMMPLVVTINNLEEEFSKLSDADLKGKTAYFKEKIKKGSTLDNILPEAFATVREASKRVLKQRHYDVQLLGGITLHNSMIAEMMTGEGKTLVSTLPAYLNALSGKGVHIVTVNDYLAERDSEIMSKLFNFLDLSVGCVTSKTQDSDRQAAYLADITYGTNNEFGFDYLRDNMKLNSSELVQREFNFAIIDEVDSILIDEARTPLIISGPADDNTEIYKFMQSLVKFFKKEEDFTVDEKDKRINFTEKGLENLENVFKKAGIIQKGKLFDSHNIHLYHYISQSLKANYLFFKETDYIVQKGEVIIIDEFTGRMMDGRRYSDGLHQALEAKEGVKVKEETQTLASITFQNYFKLYPKISGMTGTAATEAKEFLEIYGLKVLVMPPNRPLARIDKQDIIYLTYKEKENALVDCVKEAYKVGRPVLIGTVSIEKSELLSKALSKAGIKHNVLNAKNHEKEAYIIAQAGALNSVTIATNMAGRGTDIQLGGNLSAIMANQGLIDDGTEETQIQIDELTKKVSEDKQKVLSLGGLLVIGTERHESRRIDNQLRGRSGRQGEVGSSAFYISLEDDLMRIFGSSKLENILKRLGFKENEAISHSMISKSIEKAQKRVETYNFDIRKTLLRFDNVINDQRTVIYDQRKHIMNGTVDINNLINENIDTLVDNLCNLYMSEKVYRDNWNFSSIKSEILRIFNIADLDIRSLAIDEDRDIAEIKSIIKEKVKLNIKEKLSVMEETQLAENIKVLTLQVLDAAWKRNLHELDAVRGSINLRAYANKDPFHEYQRESFMLFSDMLSQFAEQLIGILCHLQIQMTDVENENGIAKDTNEEITTNKIGRNDPCICGSGLKYKNCHGKGK